jgi:hypothetical protein
VLPGGLTIPVLALLTTLAFVASATRMSLLAGLTALAAGALIYRLRRPDRQPLPVLPS